MDGSDVWRFGSGRRRFVGFGDWFDVEVGTILSLGEWDGRVVTPLSDGEKVSPWLPEPLLGPSGLVGEGVSDKEIEGMVVRRMGPGRREIVGCGDGTIVDVESTIPLGE